MVASAISARNQLVPAFPMADPARESPMQMMIGPVTTGGGKHQVKKSCYHDTAAGVGKLFPVGHICVNAGIQLSHRRESAQERKG